MAVKAKKNKQTREEIRENTIADIRSKFGEGAIMRLDDSPKSTVDIIPTGILPLNVALGVGGYPRGRIVEIFGPEGSGKTTIALCAIAEVQKMGGTAAFIDVEHAIDKNLAQALGVNTQNLLTAQPDSGEQALFIVDMLVKSGTFDLIVVDSVAALTPMAEIEGKIGETQLGLHARLMSYALRRLAHSIYQTNSIVMFTNQLRSAISTGYSTGPTETTTGGRALRFYASIRLEVRRGKKIDKGDLTIGHELYLKVVKNKLAPPFRTAHASLIYGKGIPMGVAVVDMAIDYDVIVKKGSWLAYKGETIGQGKEAVAKFLTANPKLQQEIIDAIMAEVARRLQHHNDEDEEPANNILAENSENTENANADLADLEENDDAEDFMEGWERTLKGEPEKPKNDDDNYDGEILDFDA